MAYCRWHNSPIRTLRREVEPGVRSHALQIVRVALRVRGRQREGWDDEKASSLPDPRRMPYRYNSNAGSKLAQMMLRSEGTLDAST